MTDTNPKLIEWPEPIRLHLGCGMEHRDGWCNVDARNDQTADLVWDIKDVPMPFADNSVEEIACLYTLEHVTRTHQRPVLREWLRMLKPDGKLYLLVPNITVFFDQIAKDSELILAGAQSPYAPTTMTAFEHFEAGLVGLFSDDAESPSWGQHRWGYTYPYLTHLLQEVGFVNITMPEGDLQTRCAVEAFKP